MEPLRRGGGELAWRRGAVPLAGLLLIALSQPCAAQTRSRPQAAPPASKAHKPVEPVEDDEASVSELVVTGDRPQPGAVVGDVKPELQLGPADIRSYGVSTVTELLDELAPQIRSDRGRGGEGPVVLLNGKRISGFNEIRDIPTEAIARVDILPEEAALKYGFSANQRVVNIVLRPRFRAWTDEVTGGGPTEGGQASGQGELDLFRTRRDDRINLDLKYSASSALTEDARHLTSLASGQPFDLAGNISSAIPGGEIDPALSALVGRPVTVAGVPVSAATGAPALSDFAATARIPNTSDVRRYRTLSPQTQQVSANLVLSRGILGGISATVNATLEATSSSAQQGLPGVSLLIPAGDPFSPFGLPVRLDRYVTGLGPLDQDAQTWTGHLGTSLNRDLKGWRLSLTGAYDHVDAQTDSDSGVDPAPLQALITARSAGFNPFAPLPGDLLGMLAQNRAHSQSDTANIQFLASGPILTVPAGNVRASLKLGETGSWLASSSQRLGIDQSVDLSRTATNLQANFDLPLASKRNNVLPALGELSVNFNVAADQVSDFGTLTTLGYGLNWTPVTGVTFIVSHTHDQAAPTEQQLGDPVQRTAGTRIFDFATGKTVDVVRIDGGERGLIADDRDVLKVGVTYKPFTDHDLTLTANYVESRIDNAIASLPAATAEIEAAFPERFVRDAGGNLTEVDYRPVNFALEQRKELRWGLNFSRPIGPQQTFRGRFGAGGPDARRPDGSRPDRSGPDGQRQDGGRADGQGGVRPPGGAGPDADGGPPPGPGTGGPDGGPPRAFGGEGGGGRDGGGGRGGGGRGFGGGGGAQNGRLQFAIYHTVFFQDDILIRPGVPTLDLLNGSAMGGNGGQPRHEVEAQFGFTEKGLGARLSADWKSGTSVHGGVGGGPGAAAGDLTFSDIARINLRLFADLGAQRNLVQQHRWLRGSRVTLSITNLFDQRIQVKDANGVTPLSYQPAYLDPAGRVVKLSIRKLFF